MILNVIRKLVTLTIRKFFNQVKYYSSMILGFAKFNGRNRLERDIRRDHKMKRILFNVIYGTLGFLLLNIVLYALSSN